MFTTEKMIKVFIILQSESSVYNILLQIQYFHSFRNLERCSQKRGLISEMLNNMVFKRHGRPETELQFCGFLSMLS